MSGYLDRLGSIVDQELTIPEREFTDHSLKLNVMALADGAIRRRRLRRNVLAATAFFLCVGGISTRYFRHVTPSEKPIEYRVAWAAAPAPIGKYVAPETKEPLDLRFSEGSVVQLEPGARARVARTTTHGATVLIETGGAHVNVVHRPATDWTILAGPYTVRVTGTAFNLDFESATQKFELKMQSGVVTVDGPGLTHPVEVARDQKFVHYVGDVTFEKEDPHATEVATDAAATKSLHEDGATESVAARRPSLANNDPSNAREPLVKGGWAAEVARGEYASVLKKANETGWSQVLEGANAQDLMAVANAARFLGRSEASREAFQALRRRFKGSAAALSATYLLGRLSESGSTKEALSWYVQYEREAPNGPLIAEAVGRQLLLLQATGDRSGTERLAREYVSRFPDGPYAGVARKIVLP